MQPAMARPVNPFSDLVAAVTGARVARPAALSALPVVEARRSWTVTAQRTYTPTRGVAAMCHALQASGDWMTARDISEASGVPRERVASVMRAPIRFGMVTRDDAGKVARWRWSFEA